MAMKEIKITDFEGLQIGNAENTEAATGCTVLLFGKDGAPAGLDVRGGAMVVNIGASKTDIFAVHDGHCVYRHSSDAAGDMFDEAIVSYLLRK